MHDLEDLLACLLALLAALFCGAGAVFFVAGTHWFMRH